MNIGASTGASTLNLKGPNQQLFLEGDAGTAGIQLRGTTGQYCLIENTGTGSTITSVPGILNFATDIGSNTIGFYDCGTATRYFKNVRGLNAYIAMSDQRLKTDIKDCNLGLGFINKLKPVSYKWIETVEKVDKQVDKDGNIIKDEIIKSAGVREHFGLIAQDLKETLNNEGVDASMWCLADKDDANSTQSIRYTELIGPMLKAIQELNKMVVELQSKVAILESR
jgi:hypothetical protein